MLLRVHVNCFGLKVLKMFLGFRDIQDSEIMDEVTEEAVILTTVEDMAFSLLCKYKKTCSILRLYYSR